MAYFFISIPTVCFPFLSSFYHSNLSCSPAISFYRRTGLFDDSDDTLILILWSIVLSQLRLSIILLVSISPSLRTSQFGVLLSAQGERCVHGGLRLAYRDRLGLNRSVPPLLVPLVPHRRLPLWPGVEDGRLLMESSNSLRTPEGRVRTECCGEGNGVAGTAAGDMDQAVRVFSQSSLQGCMMYTPTYNSSRPFELGYNMPCSAAAHSPVLNSAGCCPWGSAEAAVRQGVLWRCGGGGDGNHQETMQLAGVELTICPCQRSSVLG